MAIQDWKNKLIEIFDLYDKGMCVKQEIVFTTTFWFNGETDDQELWDELPSWLQKDIWLEVKCISETSDLITWSGSIDEVRAKLIALKNWILLIAPSTIDTPPVMGETKDHA